MWSRILTLHRRLSCSGPESISEIVLIFLLIPASFLYGFISFLRNVAYDVRIFPIYNSSVPIISVGNIAAGGTGKTPVVDFLVHELTAHGKHPAVLSRGYGGSFKGKAGVVSDGHKLFLDASVAGDEPYLLASRNPTTPVVIAAKRKYGAELIADKFASVDVIILDDGFQHRAVSRVCNILLLDKGAPFGNCWPLPAGILREFSGALKRADIILFTRSDNIGQSCYKKRPAFYAGYELGTQCRSLDGSVVDLDSLRSLNICAFAGIAQPESFFNSLKKQHMRVSRTVSFNDHVEYDREKVKSFAHQADIDAFVTTEKDGVKLSAEMFDKPCYQVPLKLSIAKKKSLIAMILNYIEGGRKCL